MNIEQLFEEWEKDAVIDKDDIGNASLTTAKLHAKYLRLYFNERMKLLRIEKDRTRLFELLIDYYSGNLHQDDLIELGREQYPYLLKTHAERKEKSEHDKQYIEITTRYLVQKEKVDILSEIMKSISNRGFQVRNYIEWEKMNRGFFG